MLAGLSINQSPDVGLISHRNLQRNMSAPSSPIRVALLSPSHSERAFGEMRQSSQNDSKDPVSKDGAYFGRQMVSGAREMYANRPADGEHFSRACHPDATYAQRSAVSARDFGYNSSASVEYRHHDLNLYHVASNRSTSYAGCDDYKTSLPVSATASCSLWEDSSRGWPSKHGSLEGAYRRQISADATRNLSSGCLMNSRFEDIAERTFDTFPRPFACIPVRYETPPHLRTVVDTSCESIELSPSVASDCSTVITRGQNYVEISKPFEMADVYKYSSRLRRTACSTSSGNNDAAADLRSTSSPQLSAKDKQRNPPLSPRHNEGLVPRSLQYDSPGQWFDTPVFK